MTNPKVQPQTIKTPRTVYLSNYFRDLAITALVVGVAMFIGGYHTNTLVANDAQAQVVANMKLATTPVKK